MQHFVLHSTPFYKKLKKRKKKPTYRPYFKSFGNMKQTYFYTPCNEVRGGYTGITLSVRLSVDARG